MSDSEVYEDTHNSTILTEKQWRQQKGVGSRVLNLDSDEEDTLIITKPSAKELKKRKAPTGSSSSGTSREKQKKSSPASVKPSGAASTARKLSITELFAEDEDAAVITEAKSSALKSVLWRRVAGGLLKRSEDLEGSLFVELRVYNKADIVAVDPRQRYWKAAVNLRYQVDDGNPMTPDMGPVTRVSALVGSDAELPCDTRPSMRNDSLLLVVWYRDDNPVYSYDTRIAGSNAHWMEDVMKDRAKWSSSPSALHVRGVQARDRATYNCRVDFHVSPTRNHRVALDVVELPRRPIIFDDFGKEINGIAGPYNEGEDFKLICSVHGGYPTPRIQWVEGDLVLTSLGAGDRQMSSDTSRSLTLTVHNASRTHLSSIFTCKADNTILAPPLKSSTRVDLHLRPLTVDIITREQPLSAGRLTDLTCSSTGSRPDVVITWWLNGKQLHSVSKEKHFENGNETQSVLRYTPLKGHNGLVLTCRAEHPKLNNSALESNLLLNIHYVPVATMKLGAKMNPNDIEEGDDVYFSCEIDTNPPAYKVIWEHNGVQLYNNPSSGIITTGNTNLALRNVSRHQAGQYSCTASNVEGDGKSPLLPLRIIYRPLCKMKEGRMIGAALQEKTKVLCEVEAFPPPESFEWTLNNSAGSIKVDSERFTSEGKGFRSILTYTPMSDIDYGILSCRATNLAGHQILPCVYTLSPATRPDPPTNCTVFNLTHDSLDLMCAAGYDGGLTTVFVAEVWANDGLVTNITNGAALWNLRQLGAERHLRIVVYAANARGRSDHLTFSVETALTLSPRTEAQEAWEVNWALGGVLGAAVTVALVLCLALIATRLRQRATDYDVTIPSLKMKNGTFQNRFSPQPPDDSNPDIIPLGKVSTNCGECPPDPPAYAPLSTSPEDKTPGNTICMPRHTVSTGTPLTLYSNYSESKNDSENNVKDTKSHREVVTTRTPLLGGHQESCV